MKEYLIGLFSGFNLICLIIFIVFVYVCYDICYMIIDKYKIYSKLKRYLVLVGYVDDLRKINKKLRKLEYELSFFKRKVRSICINDTSRIFVKDFNMLSLKEKEEFRKLNINIRLVRMERIKLYRSYTRHINKILHTDNTNKCNICRKLG